MDAGVLPSLILVLVVRIDAPGRSGHGNAHCLNRSVGSEQSASCSASSGVKMLVAAQDLHESRAVNQGSIRVGHGRARAHVAGSQSGCVAGLPVPLLPTCPQLNCSFHRITTPQSGACEPHSTIPTCWVTPCIRTRAAAPPTRRRCQPTAVASAAPPPAARGPRVFSLGLAR